MTKMRDFGVEPYTPDERRVCDFLQRIADIGCGADPIGFLMASHTLLVEELRVLVAKRKQLRAGLERITTKITGQPLHLTRIAQATLDADN